MSISNPYAAKSKKAVSKPVEAEPVAVEPEPTQEPVESTPEAVEEVPTGTVEEVIDWVGDDKDRAQAALEVEKDGKNRKSLIEALNDIL